MEVRHAGSEADITARLQQFTAAVEQGVLVGAFATIACPTWMMGYIQGQAGDAYKGKWDVAPVLPGGAANWGGSCLGVPREPRTRRPAIALAEWLTNKDAAGDHVDLHEAGWTLAVEPAAAADPRSSRATSAYFSDAPVGAIFGDIAKASQLPPISPYDTQIQNAFTTQLTNVETKGTSPDKAFNDALGSRSSRSLADPVERRDRGR